MARTIKKGLDYFPFDVDFFQDIRIRKLIKYQGGKAVTVYALLLCTIYKNGYYAEWDKELPFIISEQSGYTEAYIQEVIDCCMNIGLLSKELFESAKVLTSKGIQERYCNICKASRRSCVIKEYNLISASLSAIPADLQPSSPNGNKPVPASPKKEAKQKATPRPQSQSQPQPKPQPSASAPVETPSHGTPDIPSGYSASIEDEISEMKKSAQWKETVCIRYNLTPEKFDFYLCDFALKCNKKHNSFQDAKSHFCYWLQEQMHKPTQPKPKPTPTGNSKPDDHKGGSPGKDRAQRQKEWEYLQANAEKPADVIRRYGYDPDRVTLSQVLNHEWRDRNPPDLPYPS